ncbi:hypothetical protein [Bacillus sp. 1P06AnD]|uniref:hypothetical protein n=1 Tax=Bacillus sp. 1P06AnD TaxID=3132208 RepID=UPI0039A2DA9F
MKTTIPKRQFCETICINCPGSLWGEKSICRVHQKSIGEIEDCKEWHKEELPVLKIDEDQISFLDIEPALDIVQKTEEDLKNYKWMRNERVRLANELFKDPSLSISSGVAQYGDEAGLPKGSSGLSQAELKNLDDREQRMYKRYIELNRKIEKMDAAVISLGNEKERTVLECIMDGETMTAIAIHMSLSRVRLNEIKKSIVKQLAWLIYKEELSV